MAQANQPVTPTPAAPAAPPPEPDVDIAAIIGAMPLSEPREMPTEPAPPVEEPSAPDTPEQQRAAASDVDDLSDDRPWTPERHKTVAEQQRAARQVIADRAARMSNREERFKRKVTEFKDQKLAVQLVMTDVQALRSGSREQVIAAIGRLTQRPGYDVVEDINLAVAANKKREAAGNPEVNELKATVAELKAQLERGATHSEFERNIATTRSAIVNLAAPNAIGDWPHLANYASKVDRAALIEEIETVYADQPDAKGPDGKWALDPSVVFDRIERSLRKRAAGQPNPDREAATRDAAASKTQTAQSTPARTNGAIPSGDGGARRATTEDERIAALAADDDFLRGLNLL
jgi:hypothetical protein